MAANYPSSVKTFTTKADGPGNTILAAYVNALQDEITALETALLTSGLAHDLKFVDATYDLGKSGATRPRDGFFSRNVVVGGTLAVTGVATFTAQSVHSAGFQTTTGNCYVGDSANANATLGLTINQGAADDEILTLKSSDVAHGATGETETDTFGYGKKISATLGGLELVGIGESTAVTGLKLVGGATSVTTKSTAATGSVQIHGREVDGGGTFGTMNADSNLLVICADAATARFILDADGDSHQDVGTAWTNYDDGDDIARLDAVAIALAREGDPLREAFIRSFEQHRALIEAMPGKPLVTFNEDGHHFVNMSRLTMLNTGGIRQVARVLAGLTRVLVDAGVVTQAQLEAA